MFNELKNEKIIIDFENLINNVDNLDDATTSYVEFMKERILGVSGIN